MKVNKSDIFEYVTNHPRLVIIVLYFLINLFVARTFWSELIFDKSTVGAVYGEILATEVNKEKLYQNIINGQNPFAASAGQLYPFGINYLTTDSGNGFLFVFLRPFLSTHQSYFVLAALALFFANIGTYILLRKLGISRMVSFFIGLAAGYMTFIQPRVGHLTYYFFYTFPWFYVSVLTVYQSKKTLWKVIGTIAAATFFVFTLYLNLYYIVSLVVSIGLFIIYFLFFDRKTFFKALLQNVEYLILFVVASLIFLAPWIKIFKETQLFEELPKTVGWAGAIEYSSDLFGYFIPSIYSFFLGWLALFIGSKFTFAYGIFENFSYPGIIILVSFAVLLWLLYKKKIPADLLRKIGPFFFATVAFWSLTLGPFLHVLGKWGVTVDDGVRIVVPMPFALFHYLPFMSNIRSPGRLVFAFIFFAYIVVAFLIDRFLKNKSPQFKRNFFVVLALVIIMDHYFEIATPDPTPYPRSLYARIKQNPEDVTVMEIPSVVRDGFTYFGDNSGLDFIPGQLLHGKDIVGAYMGRLPPYKRDYYVRNPFLGYMGRLMDTDIKNNGSVDRTPRDLASWKVLDVETSIDTINFLDIAFVVVNRKVPYLKQAEIDLTGLGFSKIKNEKSYDLWYRKPSPREFLQVAVGSKNDDIFLGQGWNTRDAGFRWAGQKTSVMFKVGQSKPKTLQFKAASFFKPQSAVIYLNKEKVGSIDLKTNPEEYTIKLKNKVKPGINTVNFIFEGYSVPAEVLPGSTDMRQISAQFYNVGLK